MIVNKPPELLLTHRQRDKISVIIVDDDRVARTNLNHTLQMLGVKDCHIAPDLTSAVPLIVDHKPSHLIFSAELEDTPPEFVLKKVFSLDNSIVCIPAMRSPEVDDVFTMISSGAGGVLVKPFTTESVDSALAHSNVTDSIPDAIRSATCRNEALVSLLLHSFAAAARTLSQSRTYTTARYEVPERMKRFRKASDIACMFAKGGKEEIVNEILRQLESRNDSEDKQLSRFRKRVRSARDT